MLILTELENHGNMLDSWAYKVDGAWTYGGVNCTDGSDTNASSNCPYPFDRYVYCRY